MTITEHKLLDIAEPAVVEIEISSDGRAIWINVDGMCAFRATRIKELAMNDARVIREKFP